MLLKRTISLIAVLFAATPMFAGGQKEALDEAPLESAEQEIIPGETDYPYEWLIEDNEDYMILLDATGREVRINKPVIKVSPLGADSDLVAIKAFGAGDKVVTISEEVKNTASAEVLFPEFVRLPSSGSYDNPDYETIFKLRPDVVIVPYYAPGEMEKTLEPEVAVFRLDIGPPRTYREDVTKLAFILGRVDEAEIFLDWIDDHLNKLTEKTKDLGAEDKPRVFDFYGGDWGMSEGPPYGTFGKGNAYASFMMEISGGRNIAGELPGDWITVDTEWIVTENPGIIIREVFPMVTPVMGYDINDSSGAKALYEEILDKPEIAFTDAATSDEMHMIIGDFMQTCWFLGVNYMAKWFHPDIFEDLNPEEIHQEFLSRFMGLEYSGAVQGVFVYP